MRSHPRGPPCIYVHGGPGQGAQSFRRMRGDRLESLFTVDQRGSGSSDNATDYSLERVVDDFDEVRRALGRDKVYLLAHSLGGIIATRYAEKYPQHASGLVLVNASLSYPTTMRAQIAFIREQVGDTSTTPADASTEVLEEHYQRVREQLSRKSEYVKLNRGGCRDDAQDARGRRVAAA